MKSIYYTISILFFLSSCFKENTNLIVNKSNKVLLFCEVRLYRKAQHMTATLYSYNMSNIENADDSKRDDFAWSWTSVTKDAQSMFGISLLDPDGKVLDKSFGRNGQYVFSQIPFMENKQYSLKLTNATDTYNITFKTKFSFSEINRKIVYKNDTAHDVAYTIKSNVDTVYLSKNIHNIAGVPGSDGYDFLPSGLDVIKLPNTNGDSVIVYYSHLDPTNYRRMKYPIIGSPRYGTDAFETLLERKLNIGLYFINAEVYQKSIQNQEYAKNATNPFVLQPSWKGNIDTGNLIGDFSVIQVE